MLSIKGLDQYMSQLAADDDLNFFIHEKLMESHFREEINIIKRNWRFGSVRDRVITLSDVDRALKDGFRHPNILRALTYFNNYILNNLDSFNIRWYLGDLKKIGRGNSHAFTAMGGRFVVKTMGDQLHDYFVGYYGTNNLRDKIPNFAFALGIFKAGSPFLYHGEVITYAQNDESPNNYAIYENVTNSVDMVDFIKNGLELEGYLNIFTQVILALDLAYRQLDYTHYDLHDTNVLIKELEEEIQVPYSVNGVTRYLKTKYLAVIIDYGSNHIKYMGRHYGYHHGLYGIFSDKSFPMYDVFKLLVSNLFIMSQHNVELYQKSRIMLSKFTTEDLDQLQEQLSKNYGVLPAYSAYQRMGPAKFFVENVESYFSEIIANFFSLKAWDNIEIYGSHKYLSINEAIEQYSKFTIDDAYDFYNIYTHDPSEWLLRRGRSNLDTYLDQLNKELDEHSSDYHELLKDYSDCDDVDYLITTAKLVTVVNKLKSIYSVRNYIIELFDAEEKEEHLDHAISAFLNGQVKNIIEGCDDEGKRRIYDDFKEAISPGI